MPGRPARRRVLLAAAAILTVVAGVAAFLGSAPGKGLVLRFAASVVRTRLGMDVRVSGLEYRLLSRGVTLHGLAVSRIGAARPFISAERVEADLSAGVLAGHLSFRRLEIVNPDVFLDATADTGSETISRDLTSGGALPPFDLGHVRIDALSLSFRDRSSTEVVVRGASVALDGEGTGRLRGAIVLPGGLSVRKQDMAIQIDRARADVSLNGASLSLTSIAADSPLVTLGGSVQLDLAQGLLAARYDARIDAGRLHEQWEAVPSVTGALTASGTIDGPLDNPAVTITARGERLRWREVTDAELSTSGRWSGRDLVIDRYTLTSTAAGARLNGRGRIALGGAGNESALRLEVSSGDLRKLARLTRLPELPPLSLRLTADLGWPGSIPRADAIGGQATLAAFDDAPRSVPLATFEARGRGGRWIVRQEATLEGATRLTGDVNVTVDASVLPLSRIDGRLAVHSSDISAAVRHLERHGLPAPPLEAHVRAGRVRVEGTLSGTLDHPLLQAGVDADGLSVGGVDDVRLESELALDGRNAQVSRIVVEASGNRLSLRGAATLGHGPVDLVVDGRFENPTALSARLPASWRPDGLVLVAGKLDGSWSAPHLKARIASPSLETRGVSLEDGAIDLDVGGTPARPVGTLSAKFEDVSVEGQTLGALTVSAEAIDGGVRFGASLPSQRSDVSGAIGLAPDWPFQARATLQSTDLSPLSAILRPVAALPAVDGTITVSADVEGRLDQPARSSAVVTLSQLDARLNDKPVRLLQPGRIRMDGLRAAVEEPLRITAAGFSLVVSPRADDRAGVLATVEGRIEDALALLPSDGALTSLIATGPVRAQIALAPVGNRLDITGTADATLEQLQRDGREVARDVRLTGRFDRGAFEISDVSGTVLGGPFNARGLLPASWILPERLTDTIAGADDPREATLSAKADLALGDVLQAGAIERSDLTGSAQIVVEARATGPRLEDVDATLALENGRLAVSSMTLTPRMANRLRFANGRVEVAEFAWEGPRSTLVASGTIGILPGVEGDLRADGVAALALLGTMVPGADGQATFHIRVSGPPGGRRTTANVDLQDVSLVYPEWQVALADFSGTLTVDSNVIEARGLRGQLNGGDLMVDGTVPLRAGVTAPTPLRIDARDLFVEVPKGLRSQLDAALTWTQTTAGPRLAGEISISSDTYREPITELASLAGNLSVAGPSRIRALPALLADTALDVRLHSEGPLVVDQSVLKIELVPDVRLIGTVSRPALDGNVVIQEDGRIQAGGRTYRLTDSRLEFSPATGLIPRLNVIGETRVNSYLVTLRMTGAATDIETNFSSDPPLGERDVRSLLITGQTADPMAGADSGGFAVGAVSGDVLGVAGQFVGLDSVRVGTEDLDLVSSDVNPATRLTVSKRLGSGFELVLSENLEESQSTWIVIYRPVTGYEFRLSSEDNTTQALEFRHEITFGSGVSPRSRVKTVAVVVDRVRSVTLAGDPGFEADQVLADVKLRAGDRFDFRKWLEDRDRIIRFYRDREYFAARVVPLRSAGETAGKERPVDLQYSVKRGSRTLLAVAGYQPDEALMDRLRQTWSQNVVLELLGDSLARTTRGYLSDAGFLRGRAEVTVDQPEPETTRARIVIVPGPRSESRQFAFRGNQAISTERLHELARSRRLDEAAWKDPAPLLHEIEGAYALAGYLGAKASAGPIEFTGPTATLPIRIDEGPAAHIDSVDLRGVPDQRRASALEALALEPGASFRDGMGRAGRSRLERHYRDLGYRDVRVEATVVRRGPDVGLTFAVDEGPLHIVRSVNFSGIESTRPSLVHDAVRLAPGDPAGAAAESASERRLFELGTFRRAELQFEPDTTAPAAPGTVDVNALVSLEEARRFQLRYGLELSSEYNSALSQRTRSWGVAGDLRDRNFLGRGMSLGGGLRYEPDLKSVRTLFSVPRLRGIPIRTNLYVTGRREDEMSDRQLAVRDEEVEVSVEQRWRASRSIEYSWGYSSNWRDVRLTFPELDVGLSFSGTLASLNGAAVIDRRDSFFDARRGWFGSGSVQWGRRELGSDLDYLRTLVRASYYQPLGPIVVAGNTRWGRLLPLGGVPPLTVFDLFFNAGGTETVRGYSQDELTAYEFFGAPLGGTKLLVLNGELRAPLFWRLGGVLFVDAGNTFTETQSIRLRDLALGVGVGLRINTPLAPIRIDLGSPRSLGKSGFRWHFSIGQMF